VVPRLKLHPDLGHVDAEEVVLPEEFLPEALFPDGVVSGYYQLGVVQCHRYYCILGYLEYLGCEVRKVDGLPVRRITNVTEVIKLDPETNRLVTLTPFHWISEMKDKFETTGGSRILQQIRMQFGWNDHQLNQELKNRKLILDWMMKKNLRSYEEVGRIVSEYTKNPEAVLKKVKEDTR